MGKTWWKRTIVGGAVALALIGGGAVAFAQTQSTAPSNTFQSFLDDVASHLGVTPAALQNAIKQAQIDQVNQAVQNGKLTQQQAQNIQSKIQNGTLRGWGPFMGGMRGMHGRRGGFAGRALLGNAASYLGITQQQLMTQLGSGKTLAQIADSTSGKSSAGLQSYLLSQLQTRLDTAVKNGRITSAQEQQMLQKAQTQIGNLMTRQFQFHNWDNSKPGTTTTPSTSGSGA
jgi:polyhydroxyalkanoate synthesis regulator phasin